MKAKLIEVYVIELGVLSYERRSHNLWFEWKQIAEEDEFMGLYQIDSAERVHVLEKLFQGRRR